MAETIAFFALVLDVCHRSQGFHFYIALISQTTPKVGNLTRLVPGAVALHLYTGSVASPLG